MMLFVNLLQCIFSFKSRITWMTDLLKLLSWYKHTTVDWSVCVWKVYEDGCMILIANLWVASRWQLWYLLHLTLLLKAQLAKAQIWHDAVVICATYYFSVICIFRSSSHHLYLHSCKDHLYNDRSNFITQRASVSKFALAISFTHHNIRSHLYTIIFIWVHLTWW